MESMRLQALKNDLNAYAYALSFLPCNWLMLKYAVQEAKRTVSHSFLQLLLNDTSVGLSRHLKRYPDELDTGGLAYLTRRAIFMTNTAELEESNIIFGAHIPRKMRTFTSADTVENEHKNMLRNPMNM